MAAFAHRNDLGKLPTPSGDPVEPDGDLKLVESASEYPFHPTGFQDSGPYVDINYSLLGVHLYLSRNTVQDAANLFGFVEKDVHDGVVAQANDLLEACEELQAKLDDAEKLVELLEKRERVPA